MKPVYVKINGIYYNSLTIAAKFLGVDVQTIKRRCLSKIYQNYYITKYEPPKFKICRLCNKKKPLVDFHLNRSLTVEHHRSSDCKKCHSNAVVAHTKKDRTKARINQKRFKKTIKGKISIHIYKARRRAQILDCFRTLSVDQKKQIKLIYTQARKLRAEGHDVEVDHIIPLSRGGSHSPENLQIISAMENRKKSNR